MQTPIRKKRTNFRTPYFCLSKCRPLHSAAPDECPPYVPFPAATANYIDLHRVPEMTCCENYIYNLFERFDSRKQLTSCLGFSESTTASIALCRVDVAQWKWVGSHLRSCTCNHNDTVLTLRITQDHSKGPNICIIEISVDTKATHVHVRKVILYLASVLSSEITARNLTKLCHMFGSEPDLKLSVKNLRVPSPLKVGPKTAYFRVVRRRNTLRLRKMLRHIVKIISSNFNQFSKFFHRWKIC